jgi:heme/copper-type cytochrome/quinol oxidase subunit 4
MSDDDPEPTGRSRALVGLVVIVLLVVGVLFIMHRLDQAAKMQDCLASGRTNCTPIETQRQ